MTQETWFEIEYSHRDENDWYPSSMGIFENHTRTFDSWITAKSAIDRVVANEGAAEEYEFRVVEVTQTRKVV